jgi:hypothetical protein
MPCAPSGQTEEIQGRPIDRVVTCWRPRRPTTNDRLSVRAGESGSRLVRGHPRRRISPSDGSGQSRHDQGVERTLFIPRSAREAVVMRGGVRIGKWTRGLGHLRHAIKSTEMSGWSRGTKSLRFLTACDIYGQYRCKLSYCQGGLKNVPRRSLMSSRGDGGHCGRIGGRIRHTLTMPINQRRDRDDSGEDQSIPSRARWTLIRPQASSSVATRIAA